MTTALFFRLVTERDKVEALQSAVSQVNAGGPPGGTAFSADPETFSQIPGSPFAYWAGERIRELFAELPPFEGSGRTVKQGLATADDFRFVRAWWEVDPAKLLTGTPQTTPEEFRQATFMGKKWVPFAKGGAYSPYYADLHLVVNWEKDGEEIKGRLDPRTGRPYSNVWQLRGTERDYFFRPGLTWPRRTQRGLNVRVLPLAAVFADKGPTAFFPSGATGAYLAVMNSHAFRGLLSLQVAFGSYEVGAIQRTPVPAGGQPVLEACGQCSHRLVSVLRDDDETDETSHAFLAPALLPTWGETPDLAEQAYAQGQVKLREALMHTQAEVDALVAGLYDIELDTSGLEDLIPNGASRPDAATSEVGGDAQEEPPNKLRDLAADLLSWCVGVALGRFSVRHALAPKGPQGAPYDPELPLPAQSPAMFSGGMIPPDYELDVDVDGILTEDESSAGEGVVGWVRRVLELVWPHAGEAIDSHVCRALGVRNLRDHFRDPRGFFNDHIKRYSKSRRKAPIYWQLRSASKSYSIWLYYHRITGDTLWKVLSDYVEPKIEHERRRLGELESKVAKARAAGSGPQEREVGREIERQKALLDELAQFRADIREVAEMGYQPDRDDGVIINIAPLHKLVPWPEAAVMWKELLEGKYPWSTMSTRIREWQAKSK